ncbi:MAG: DegT/DnrJ/EryC1/StrS family aminotransferase [Thermoanaerobaculia bacterium]
MSAVSAPPAVSVPLLDLKKQYAAIREDVKRTADELFESQMFILGPRVEAFEKAVAVYVGTKHAVGMSSGTDAQLAAMMALRIGPGDDVVTSPYTFFSSAGAIARLGARPVFCDIEPGTFNVDPAKLAKAITPKTKAIQPVHLYGQCADMSPILDVARKKGIPVIEDACQSLGAAYEGKKAGALSEFGCFSFFPSKNLGAFGDGGMVMTNDDQTAQTLRAMRMHGETSRYHHRFVGGNFRLDAFQAAVLHVKLPHLDGWAEGRRKNAKEIEALYLESGGLPYEKGGLAFPREASRRFHVFNQFVVRVGKGRRDGLKERLAERQIGCAIYYPVPLHLQECFAYLGGRAGDFPQSEKAAGETLALPVFPELTGEQKRFLAFTLAEFSRG